MLALIGFLALCPSWALRPLRICNPFLGVERQKCCGKFQHASYPPQLAGDSSSHVLAQLLIVQARAMKSSCPFPKSARFLVYF